MSDICEDAGEFAYELSWARLHHGELSKHEWMRQRVLERDAHLLSALRAERDELQKDADELRSTLKIANATAVRRGEQRDESLAMAEKLREALRELHDATMRFVEQPHTAADTVRWSTAMMEAEKIAALTPSRALADLKARVVEQCANERPVLKGYGDGYETSNKRVPYHRGWQAGQKAMAKAIRALAAPEEADRGA